MLNRNVVFPSLLIVISAVTLYLITLFEEPMFQEASVDAAFFPTAIVIAQIILCIVLLVQHKMAKANSADADANEPVSPIFSKLSIFGLGYLAGYAVLIYFLGYLIASLTAFVFYLLYFKVKKPLYYAVAVIFVFCIYYLFGEVFVIALPEGALF